MASDQWLVSQFFPQLLGLFPCDSYHIRKSGPALASSMMHPTAARTVRHYRDLIAWQQAVELVSNIYRSTRTFPSDERYSLTSQIRRAAVSVPSNIAEGQGRCSTGEFRQFLGHARGSLLELETQLIISRDLNYLREDATVQLLSRIAEVGRILNGLLNALRDE